MFDRALKNDKGQIVSFTIPTQVSWFEDDGEGNVNVCYGIGYNNEVICACCGAVIPLEDIYEDAPANTSTEDVIKVFHDWIDFTEYIEE